MKHDLYTHALSLGYTGPAAIAYVLAVLGARLDFALPLEGVTP